MWRRGIAGRKALRRILPLLGVTVALAGIGDPPYGKPDAVVDLATAAGVQSVSAAWRYSDARIVDIDSRGVGADLKPSGAPVKTYDILPKAGEAGFDDSQWPVIAPESLTDRRTNGRVAFAWYRIGVTIPERVGKFAAAGSTVAFELVIDDYAEIWVNGQLPQVLGQSGGNLVKGWNAPNRVILTRNARPGEKFQIAVFGINGPISFSPHNFIWIRSATLDFHSASKVSPVISTGGSVRRLDSRLDSVIGPDTKIEKLAGGFQFTEGPVWVNPTGAAGDGYLLISDPNNNTIYRYTPDGSVSVFRPKSGYSGSDIGEYGQPGSNGLALDAQGRLTVNEHGRRRVVRIEKNGVVTVLADNYQGKRLNSPNDLVYRSDGALYFSDPPFGLPKFFDDPRKELPFSGVFRWKDGDLKLVSKDLTGPNGLAFTPDERFLYVTNWDEKKKVVMRYPVLPDGTLDAGEVFFNMGAAPESEALDGIKVDRAGNLFVSGPGGVWIIAPHGRHIGMIEAPELPANMAWGDDDRRTLYMTARTGLYRIRLLTGGATHPATSSN